MKVLIVLMSILLSIASAKSSIMKEEVKEKSLLEKLAAHDYQHWGEKRFYVGVDLNFIDGNRDFRTNEPPAPTDGIDLKLYVDSMGTNFNFGYQYYYTKISFNTMRTSTGDGSYSETQQWYGVSVDFLPIFYEDDYQRIRGSFGLSGGMIHSSVSKVIVQGEPSFFDTQDNGYTGFNTSLLWVRRSGLYLEWGFRYRASVTNSQANTSVTITNFQKYIGLGYYF